MSPVSASLLPEASSVTVAPVSTAWSAPALAVGAWLAAPRPVWMPLYLMVTPPVSTPEAGKLAAVTLTVTGASPLGVTVTAELSSLPAGILTEDVDRVPPATASVTVRSKGAAWATATVTWVAVVCCSAAVKVKGLPGLLARNSPSRSVRPSNRSSGNAVSPSLFNRNVVRLVSPSNTSAGNVARVLLWFNRSVVRLVRPSNTSTGSAARRLLLSDSVARVVSPSKTSSGNAVKALLFRYNSCRLSSPSKPSAGTAASELWFSRSTFRPVSSRKSRACTAVRLSSERSRVPVMPRRSASVTSAQALLLVNAARIALRTAVVRSHTPSVMVTVADARSPRL